MSKIYLGTLNCAEEEFIKDQWCDIFIKEDGTKVRPDYDPSKTMVNIYDVADYQNVKQFSFGKSYTGIDNLYYYDKVHGIDLSRTKIGSGSFNILELQSNQLTSFSLPASLTGFDSLYLHNNQLTSISLPASLTGFNLLDLQSNSLTSISLPASLKIFENLHLGYNSLTSFQLPASLTSFTDLFLYGNTLTSISLPASLTGFNLLELDNSCNLDMSHITDVTKIPQLYDGIRDKNYDIYSGIIQIKSGLLTAFQDKWGSRYNYQEV